MKNLIFLLAPLLLMTAGCDPGEDLGNYSTPQDDDVLIQASTAKQCDTLANDLGSPPYPTSGIAELFECLLNVGLDEDDIEMNCDVIDTYEITSFCADPQNIADQYISSYEPLIIASVVNNTDDCNPCLDPDPTLGCRTIIYSVTYVDDECQGGGQDEWEFTISARVFCCD